MNTKLHFIKTLSFFLIFFSSITLSQQGGINLSVAIPQGEFADQIDNLGYGITGELMILSPKPKSPFGFGIDLGYYIYGSESRSEPLYNIPEVLINVNRTNNLVNFHIVFELGLPSGRIRPYVQGLFGGSYLYTNTSVSGQNSSQEIASTTNYDDWAWSYGAGGGVSILLTGDPVTEDGAIYLDFRGKYLFGSEATYLKEGAVEVIGQQVRYYPSNSKTDLISVHAGVRIAFKFHSDE
jgi:hypothetical protein